MHILSQALTKQQKNPNLQIKNTKTNNKKPNKTKIH